MHSIAIAEHIHHLTVNVAAIRALSAFTLHFCLLWLDLIACTVGGTSAALVLKTANRSEYILTLQLVG